jgi:lipopolysaccharide biosynthesis glycosyltransferase
MSSITDSIIHIRQGDGLNIAYACDNNFVDVMCVSIMSFNDHNCDANIYILDCGIEEATKKKILDLCSGKNAVFFVDAKKTLDRLDYDLNLDRGSIASYARLFIGSMLPDNVKKVIYLDSDTLIRDSLEGLYNSKLNPYIIGGIRDSFSELNKRVFGIKKGGLMVNAGVLLIDLVKWRENRIEKQIYQLLEKKQKIFQGDQGVINSVFHGNVKELSLKYDVMSYLYDFTYEEMMLYRKPDNYFEKREVEVAKQNPVIVHFSSSFRSSRPWIDIGDCQHPFLNEWLAIYPNKVEEHSKERNIATKQKITLWCARYVHAYFRPLVYLIKNIAHAN